MKMLLFAVILVFASVLCVQAGPLSLENKEKLYRYHYECLEESKVDDQIVAKFCLGEESNDPKLKDYLYCASKKLGFQNGEGEIQIETIKTKLLISGYNQTKIDEVVEKCAIKKESELDTAYNLFNCYRENTPDYDGIFYIISLTPVNLKKLYQYHKDCVEQTSVDENLIKISYEKEFSDDPLFKKYLVCVTKKLGFIDDDGKVLKDTITQKLSKVIKETVKVGKLVELCVSEKESSDDTVYAMMKCFQEKSYITFLPPIPLSPEKVQKLTAYSKECKKETSVDKSLVLEAAVGNFTEDAALKEYLLCMNKLVGFQDAEGVLQKDVIKQKIASVLNDTKVSEELLEKCALPKDTPAETAYDMVKCYFEKTPSNLNIFTEPSIPEEQINKFKKYNEECMVETAVDKEIIDQAKQNKFVEDEKFKKHILCFSKKLGAQNELGEFQNEEIAKVAELLLGHPDLAERTVNKCIVTFDRPEESTYKAMLCVYDNAKMNVFALL